MPVEEPQQPAAGGPAARDARRLMRAAITGSLATLERDSGHPYASLVLLATAPDATPVFLISRLALHTRNLEKDPRASIMVQGGGFSDPMAASRLTLMGEARPVDDATARRRFLARHPSAAGYAGFADFALYALAVSRGHYIGGFGNIVDLGRELISPTGDAEALVAAEAPILAHMNADHADAVGLYATALAGKLPGPWRMTGIDPDGADLLHCSNAARIDFPRRVRSPGEARAMLAELANQARAVQQGRG
jgi:putative heme iron utilization protein